MACTRCQQRQQAIARAAQAVKAGDAEAAAKEAAFVVITAAQDARTTFATSVAAARNRLSSLRR